MQRLNIDKCYKLAESRLGKFLSTEYINNRTRYLWECQYKHTWKASYDNVSGGTWCPYCAGKYSFTVEKFEKLTKKYDGNLLEKNVKTTTQKAKIMCNKGHIWSAHYNNVLHGRWCPYCAGKAPLSLEIAKQIAKENNGTCLSKTYQDCSIPLLWQCLECRGVWKNSLSNVKHKNQWCPVCSSRKSQRLLYKMLQNLFKYHEIKYNYHGFDWLRTSSTSSLELDFYVPELKLAIEYDGEQHYRSVEFFGGQDGFIERKRRDFLKNKLIYQNRQDVKTFIRIPHWEEITEKNVRNILYRNGVI